MIKSLLGPGLEKRGDCLLVVGDESQALLDGLGDENRVRCAQEVTLMPMLQGGNLDAGELVPGLLRYGRRNVFIGQEVEHLAEAGTWLLAGASASTN